VILKLSLLNTSIEFRIPFLYQYDYKLSKIPSPSHSNFRELLKNKPGAGGSHLQS
jgi:hypothetical protein